MLWSGFLLGFFGSFHCLGMCAPIAFAMQQGRPKNSIVSKLLYNSGRVATYIILGAIVGLLGNVLAFSGWQKWLSISSGVLMVMVGLLAVNLDTFLLKSDKIRQLYSRLGELTGKAIRQKKSAFLIGMLNGLLPCGLVYFALFGAMASANLSDGLLYMLFFGLGTFPLMLGTALAGQFVQLKWRNAFKKIYPVLFICLGVFIIYKASNLESVQGRAGNGAAMCE